MPGNITPIESALKSLENISFKAKHYFTAGLWEWTITYERGSETITLTYQYKSEGYIDGLTILSVKGGSKEKLFVVWGGDKEIFREEKIELRDLTPFMGVIPIIFGAVMIRLYFRTIWEMKSRFEIIRVVIDGFEFRWRIYKVVWALSIIYYLVMPILIVYELLICETDFFVAIYLLSMLLISMGLLATWFYATKTHILARERIISSDFLPRSFVPIIVMMAMNLFSALMIVELIQKGSSILTLLLILFGIIEAITIIKLSPQSDYRVVKEKLIEIKRELELKSNGFGIT